jgi:deoxyribodipyrimidine photo-lyase
MKKRRLGLHIFRRDLRIQDNTALLFALENCEKVIPCFIFDKKQVDDNKFRSLPALQFMIGSLKDLDAQLKSKGGRLYIFFGATGEVVDGLIGNLGIDLLTVNRDYTPFSRSRDDAIKKICTRHGTDFSSHGDALLNEPESVHKNDQKPYTVFTAFYNKSAALPVKAPISNNFTNYYVGKIENEHDHVLFGEIVREEKTNPFLKGGRKEATLLLDRIPALSRYSHERDVPAISGTSHLSAHNKFGTVSIREVYHSVRQSLGGNHALLRQLYWRDFFTHIAYHFPHTFGHSFNQRYDSVRWVDDDALFLAWCDGKTGYPIVDAGMRELNETGYMHNRVRMITASFLVKDLHADWRKGEMYFATRLIDYDPCVNNGNWQWAASTGCDSQPYFRIFNPWRQQERFDPECEYIKRWVPQLKDLSAQEIHSLEKTSLAGYPAMIVDHKEASAKTKAMFTLVAKKG